jgi:nitrogen fixation protein NifB
MSGHVTQASLVRHPCFSASAHGRYGRIHLPVAPECNLGCNYCQRQVGGMTYHSYRPAVADRILTPQQALCRVAKYAVDASFTVVGIAGPGEPLYNPATFETLRLVGGSFPEMMLCLSTNGLLLPRHAQRLHALGVRTITVTLNTVDTSVGEKIYAYARHNGRTLTGRAAARLLLENQLAGIREAARLGLVVKVNSILIPGINDEHLEEVARTVKALGVYVQNITPLIPLGRFKHRPAPSCDELRRARSQCERAIRQFRLCEQCRADSVGPLGRVPRPCRPRLNRAGEGQAYNPQ